MPIYPRLKTYLTIYPKDDTAWMICGAEGELWRIGVDSDRQAMLGRLLPLLNGKHTLEAIVERLAADGLNGELAIKLIDELVAASIVQNGEDVASMSDPDNEIADQRLFLSRFTLNGDGGRSLQQLLAATRISVVCTGLLSRLIVRELVAAGADEIELLGENPQALESHAEPRRHGSPRRPRLTFRELDRGAAQCGVAGASGALIVVPLESWDPMLVEAVNEAALASQTAWLLVQSRSVQEGIVGPLFVPGQTACYMCLEARLRSNLAFFGEYDALKDHLRTNLRSGPTVGALHASTQALAALATLEIVKFVTRLSPPRLLGTFCSVNWFTLETELHEVLRLPRCSVCRPPQVETFPWSHVPVPPEDVIQ